MPFISENELEQALVKAAKDPAAGPDFYRLLLESALLVMGTAEGKENAAEVFSLSDGGKLNLIADNIIVASQSAINDLAGLTTEDRGTLTQRYPFLEFTPPTAGARFQLHLGQGWQFFAPDNLITRLTAVLHAEPDVVRVGINLADATTLNGHSAPEGAVRRSPDTGRYVLTDTPYSGPAMVDTTRLDPAKESRTASLDEVFCIAAG